MIVVVLALLKILIMVGFLLQMAALATWADRRQSAMVQDRVGPNRAVVHLPSMVVRFILLLPPALFATLAGFAAYRGTTSPPGDAALMGAQLSVLVGWFSLLVLCFVVRRKGAWNGFDEMVGRWSPRGILITGLVLHVVAFVAVAMVPAPAMPTAAKVTHGLLAAVLAAVAIYSAAKVPEGKVGIRLAGTLHAIADTIKMVWKEDFIPPKGDRILHSLAPILAVFPVLVTCAVIPFGRSMCFRDMNRNSTFDFADLRGLLGSMPEQFQCGAGHHTVQLQIADLNVGLLYIFAMAGTGVIGAAIAGWASDNKWSLLGGLRAASQMVSYEVAMGISLIGLLLIYGTVRLGPMVEWQGTNAWGVFVQPFGFLLFLVALLAETKRVPFDQPEGESEIVAGYFVEYSGLKWGMFMTGEYVEVITSSILLVTLFFGGYALPFMTHEGVRVAFGDNVLFVYKMNHLAVVVISALAFFGKVVVTAWLQIFIRWTVPRFRYDQLMKLGWTRLLPLSIVNLLVTAMVLLAVRGNADAESALAFAGDITQAIVALGIAAAVVAMFFGLVEPVKREKLLLSTAQRFAAAAGGVRMSARQA